MLKKLRIQNFKGWKDTGEIQLAPITLFFGTNSSGKSSIGQFLMLLKQTIESSDRKAVFSPGSNNSAVQLGSYHEMVYRRDLTNRISFEYTWTLPSPIRIKNVLTGGNYTSGQIRFEATVGMEDDHTRLMCVEKLKYALLLLRSGRWLSVGMERAEGKKHQYRVDSERYTLKRNPGRVWHPGAPVQFYGFPDEVVAYYQNAEFVKQLNFQNETLFKSIFYLGPLRSKTDRLYSWSGTTPESVGYSGENTIAAILAARGRKISLGYRKTAKPLEQIIAESLKRMGLIDDFEIKPISKQRQEYEVRVLTKGSAESVDLPDVGFGISQVLPVLVQCFYAPPGSIIIMEQPEIHLHPKAQSELADVMIDVIKSRENGVDRNIQLIIETHSEHFLRRLQRRISEDAVSKEKVSAYFADITKTPAILDPLQIDIFGSIKNWPENFFGDEMEDITAQAKAALKKHMAQIALNTDAQSE
jgi:predicted ATPase